MRWPSSPLRTLRFRLTLWNSFVVIIVGISALAILRIGIRYTLIHEADTTLREEFDVLSLAIDQLHPDHEAIRAELVREVEGHRDHDWFIELWDERGEVSFRSDNVPASVTAPALRTSTELRFAQIENHRIVERRRDAGLSPAYTLRIGTSLDYVDQDVDRLTRGMLPVIAILIVSAPLGGYLLARQATSPIRSIIETTKRLRPSRMQERLRIRGTGDELDQLSDTINRFLDVIAGYVKQHEEFVGNAAHELRSPLAAIRTSVDVALSKDREPAEYSELLIQVADECTRLEHLVNQLLSLAENDGGATEAVVGPVRWDMTLRRCIDVFEALAEDREIDLRIDLNGPTWIAAEEHRLRQVMMNLLDNALKFTPAGGYVEIRLSTQRERSVAVLEIEDSGCGIAEEDLPRLFERFFRAERSRTRPQGVGGTGLGLSICRRIVERFGGRVSIRSPARPNTSPASSAATPTEVLPGTIVTVEWPLANPADVPT